MTEERDMLSGGGEAIVIFVTVSSPEEGERIARRLLEDRLAACINILPHIRSFFSWEGKISDEQELLLIIKSERGLFADLAKAVKECHSYSVPEIIAVPILEGTLSYLQWIQDVTHRDLSPTAIRPGGES